MPLRGGEQLGASNNQANHWFCGPIPHVTVAFVLGRKMKFRRKKMPYFNIDDFLPVILFIYFDQANVFSVPLTYTYSLCIFSYSFVYSAAQAKQSDTNNLTLALDSEIEPWVITCQSHLGPVQRNLQSSTMARCGCACITLTGTRLCATIWLSG